MKVLNIHSRTISQPLDKVVELLDTLATPHDHIWPKEHWPAMRLNKGLAVNSTGGHGPIGYTVEAYQPKEFIQFQFTKPRGFHGFHKLEIAELSSEKTKLTHTIDIQTSGIGTFSWIIAIRWLHDALIEDAFDKVENHFSTVKKRSRWNLWVRMLRRFMTPRKGLYLFF